MNKVFNQQKLRLYNFCSLRYSQNENEDLRTDELQVVEKAFEYYFIQQMKGYPFDIKGQSDIISKALTSLSKKLSFTPTEYQSLAVKSNAILHKLLTSITLKAYTPIYGAFDFRVKINKIAYDIHLSGIATTENGSIRAWVFSPWQSEKNIFCDPVHQLQFNLLHKLKDDFRSSSNNIVLYIIFKNYDNKYTVTSINKKNNKLKKQIEYIEYGIINEIFNPINPCSHINCPYFRSCTPWTLN